MLLSFPQGNLIPDNLTEENPLRTDRVSYLSNLTPLRGIAALLTVIFHINIVFWGDMVPASGSRLRMVRCSTRKILARDQASAALGGRLFHAFRDSLCLCGGMVDAALA